MIRPCSAPSCRCDTPCNAWYASEDVARALSQVHVPSRLMDSFVDLVQQGYGAHEALANAATNDDLRAMEDDYAL